MSGHNSSGSVAVSVLPVVALLVLALAAGTTLAAESSAAAAHYRNSMLQSDDSDPDAIRVGDSYSMATATAKIDRYALVTRHDPVLTQVDPSSPLMVGNGNIAFTADITGLQTFQERYSPLAPLLTQAQWAWHSFPNPDGHEYENSLTTVNVRGEPRRYPWLRDWSEAKRRLQKL